MKGKFFVLGLAMLLLLGLSIGNALAASSVTYLGKSTWIATITDDTKPENIGASFTITGGISKVGDEFYLFQGYVTQGSDGPFVISGSGFMMGTTLIFTLCESQKHTDTWRDGGVMHVEIDKTTQGGTFYDIGHDFNIDAGSRAFDQRYTAGTLALAGSPIPLSATTVPQQFLLLN
ncbi:MAG: hypothetical protein PHU44_11515 [Syntrophales bacterium]|nr:hypothetical protein [Syntrophales bacterium]MDD5642275.1 hypothetical protein [Syntrophales bacterium]